MLKGLQVAQRSAEEEARTACAQLLAQSNGASKETDLSEEIREMQMQMQMQMQKMFGEVFSGQQKLMTQQQQAAQLLGAIAMDELNCPRVPWLQPDKGRTRFSPKSWFTKEFSLYFICPVTCAKAETNDGKGYPVVLPRDWVVTYGPAIKVGADPKT